MPRAFDSTPESDVIVDSATSGLVQHQHSVDSLGWFYYTKNNVFPGKFYNDTEEAATDGCWATFQFKGNRVAVYGYVPAASSNSSSFQPTKTSYAIDGQQKVTYSSSYSADDQHNVRYYWSDLLDTGDHTLTITVEEQGDAALVLDWLEYNVTRASDPFPTSASSTSMTASITSTQRSVTFGADPTKSPDPHPSSKAAVPVGALAGGVIGGLALIALAVFAILFWRRRRYIRSMRPENVGKEHGRPDLLSATTPYHGPVSLPFGEGAPGEPPSTSPSAPSSNAGVEPSNEPVPISPPPPPVAPPHGLPPQPVVEEAPGAIEPAPRRRGKPGAKREKATYQPQPNVGEEVSPDVGASSSAGAPGPPVLSVFDDAGDGAETLPPPAYTP